MADAWPIVITSGGAERTRQVAELYQKAFKDDPVFAYMLSHLSDEDRQEYLLPFFMTLLRAAGLNSATFDEANNFASAAVALPPGKRVDNPWTILQAGFVQMVFQIGVRATNRMLFEYGGKVDAAKKKGLKGATKYWYLFFAGTQPSCQGQGLGGRLIEQVLKRAEAQGVPAWIEATSEGSCRLYTRCGFELVEEVRLGKGVADVNGKTKAGGEGVPVWTLVWWPSDSAMPSSR